MQVLVEGILKKETKLQTKRLGPDVQGHSQKDFVDGLRRSARNDIQGLASEAHVDIVIRLVAEKSQIFMAPKIVAAALPGHDVFASDDSTSSSVAPLAKIFMLKHVDWADVNAKSMPSHLEQCISAGGAIT